jgi:hypothetical protein
MQEFTEHGMPQPAGNAWVLQARMRRIKAKMLTVAKTSKEMFSLLDTDASGALSAVELAGGLFRLGIWYVLIMHTYTDFHLHLHVYIALARTRARTHARTHPPHARTHNPRIRTCMFTQVHRHDF